MDLRVYDPGRACSTTCFGHLSNGYFGPVSEDRRKVALKMLDTLIASGTVGGTGHKLKAFSFVIASTLEEQTVAEKLFEDLGFTGTERVYNSKNTTKPKLWVIDVPAFLKNSKKLILDELGEEV